MTDPKPVRRPTVSDWDINPNNPNAPVRRSRPLTWLGWLALVVLVAIATVGIYSVARSNQTDPLKDWADHKARLNDEAVVPIYARDPQGRLYEGYSIGGELVLPTPYPPR